MNVNLKQHIWKIITAVVTLFGLIAAVWAFEDRYANKSIVTAGMENLQKQQEDFQKQQRVFQQSQEISIRQQQINYLQSRIEFCQQTLEQVRYDKSIVINQLHRDPGNVRLREQKGELERRETKIQQRLERIMTKLGNID